jgi:hypothetical protein
METARGRGRHGHRDATMMLIAYRHGLRAAELCASNAVVFRHSPDGAPTKTGTSVLLYHPEATPSSLTDRAHSPRVLIRHVTSPNIFRSVSPPARTS